jgi:peptidyl-tRNA hydrolase
MGIAPTEPQDANERLTDFVLGKFSPAESTHLAANWGRFLHAIEQIIRMGPTLAANSINQRTQSKQPSHDASV